MSFLPPAEVETTLRRLGASEYLIRMARGERLHPLLDYRCAAPSYLAAHGAAAPRDTTLIALWDCCDTVTALRILPDRSDFIAFDVEHSDEFRVLAQTEQGLWSSVFVDVIEDEPDSGIDELAPAAAAVGFRHLPHTLAQYDCHPHATAQQHRDFFDALVRGIDLMSACPSSPAEDAQQT